MLVVASAFLWLGMSDDGKSIVHGWFIPDPQFLEVETGKIAAFSSNGNHKIFVICDPNEKQVVVAIMPYTQNIQFRWNDAKAYVPGFNKDGNMLLNEFTAAAGIIDALANESKLETMSADGAVSKFNTAGGREVIQKTLQKCK